MRKLFNKFQKTYVQLFLALVVSLLLLQYTTPLRVLSYGTIPESNAILDEFAWAWQGVSIRTSGIPVGWSDVDAYSKEEQNRPNQGSIKGFQIELDKQLVTTGNFQKLPKPAIAVYKTDTGMGDKYYRFVMPFIDHPPLGGLIYSLGVPSSIKNFSEIKAEHFRKINQLLYPLSAFLLFALVYQLSRNALLSFLAFSFYLTIPTFVFGTRFALLENILSLLSLISLNLLLLSKNLLGKNKRLSFTLLILSSITGGLMLLTKLAGLGFLIGFVVLLYKWELPRKYLIAFIPISLLIGSLYFIWGLWLSSELFLNLLLYQGESRFFGPLSFLTQLLQLRFKTFPLDGWWLWGFISMVVLALTDKDKYFPIIVPAISYLLVVLFLGGPNHAWFYLALFPYFAIACGWSVFKLITQPNLLLLILFLFVPFSSSLYWGYFVFHPPANVNIFRVILIIIFAIYTLRYFIKMRTANIIWVIFFSLVTLQIIKWNIQSYYFMIINWTKLPIPTLPTIY